MEATIEAPKARTVALSELPPEVRMHGHEGYATRAHVILIGAGGVGARLAPLLVKHLIPHDALTILDHDIVEMKNIQRQHFVSGDVGRAKAEVVALRAAAAAPQEGVYISHHQLKVEGEAALAAVCPDLGGSLASWSAPHQINGRLAFYMPVVISCVDSIKARRAIRAAVDVLLSANSVGAWVDCGNDMLNGQALVGALRGLLAVREVGAGAPSARYVHFRGWEALAPRFLEREDEADTADPCAVRVDTQTVLANAWATLAAATLAVPFITGAPITSLGVSFSARSGGTRTVGVKAVRRSDTWGDEYALDPTSTLLA